jgi:hypothetical protein
MIVTLSLRVASDEDSPGSIDILLNGNEKAAGVNVRNTGGWSSFERIETGKISLTPEDTIIRLAFKQGGFNLGQINVKESETGLEDKKPAEPVRCYPNPVGNTLYLFAQKDIDFIEIIDLRGNILFNEHISGTHLRRWKKNIQNLTNGLYLLHIGFLDNSTHTLEFYKK